MMNALSPSPVSAPDRLLKRREVEAMTAMSCAAIYAKMDEGRFPRPVRIGTGPRGAVAWRLSDIQKWIESRAMRPMILNGIDNIVGRSDLADRAIFLTLRTIPDTDRKTEEELLGSFEEVRPKILGALEPALFPEGPFMAAYTANRDGANAAMVEGNPLANAVRTLMDEQESKAWEGTASDLYNKLKEIVGEATTKGKEWPANAQALSRRTNSLASTLRPLGIEITRHKRSGGIRHIEISARPESAHRIAPIARNGRNSTASFGETDEGTSPPSATSNATSRHTAERTAPTDSSADDLVNVEGRAAITEHDGGRPRYLCPHLLFPNDLPTDF